jgi:hypothetical protein
MQALCGIAGRTEMNLEEKTKYHHAKNEIENARRAVRYHGNILENAADIEDRLVKCPTCGQFDFASSEISRKINSD